MEEVVRELEAVGVDVIDPVEVAGEMRFKSRALDRLGPSELNQVMFEAFDAGRLKRSPWTMFASTPNPPP